MATHDALYSSALDLSARTGTFRHEAAYVAAAENLLRGDLNGAEIQANEAVRLGLRVGAPKATIRMAHLAISFGIRWETGRLDELELALRELTDAFPGRGMDAMLALALSNLGMDEETTGLLDRKVAGDFDNLPSNNLRLMIAGCAAEAAANVTHRAAAASLYDLLLPYSGRTAAI